LWFQKFSCAALFAIELGAPWLIFGPRNLRRLGCGAMSALQLMIAATGNYNFFNLLTIAPYLLLLDDDVWPPRWTRMLRGDAAAQRSLARKIVTGEKGGWPLLLIAPVA